MKCTYTLLVLCSCHQIPGRGEMCNKSGTLLLKMSDATATIASFLPPPPPRFSDCDLPIVQAANPVLSTESMFIPEVRCTCATAADVYTGMRMKRVPFTKRGMPISVKMVRASKNEKQGTNQA
jgi:hypothetical protein